MERINPEGLMSARGGILRRTPAVVRRVKPLILAFALLAVVPLCLAAEREKAVTLDVKDADVREVLKSMQRQCGIRNLVIDPDVSGQGTFYFRDVPCEAAFRTVFRTTGLRGRVEPNSVITVSRR